MKKLIPAALIAMFLAGCGASSGLMSPTVKQSGMNAHSQAGVNRGIRGQFTYLFESLDENSDTFLSKDEMWAGSFQANTGVPADAAVAAQNKSANMATLDTNRDGKVTVKEFQNPGIVKAMMTLFRYEIGKTFANLDLNGDRLLTAEEVGTKLPITFEEADLNHNEKVTLSELEDAVAEYSLLGGGRRQPSTPVEPPAPEPGSEG